MEEKSINKFEIHWKTSLDQKIAMKRGIVLLVVDNAACSKYELVLEKVKMVFRTPNTTFKHQPLDHGIMKRFKLEYGRYVLHLIITQMDDSVNASGLAKQITVADAVED